MLSAHHVLAGRGFSLSAVSCRADRRGGSDPEPRDHHGVVLVRRGRFRRRLRGVAVDVDPTVGYLTAPGDEEQFSHPAGGDLCTSLELSARLWERVVGPVHGRLHEVAYVDASLELAHRRLLAGAESGDVAYRLAEAAVRLLAQLGTGLNLPRDSRSLGRDRTVVAAAREALHAGEPAAADLVGLADELDISPYVLSRAFTRHLGVSLTRYRNRLRVSRAMDRLQAGEHDLAGLAADLGFADQAHLNRTLRQHLDHTPTEVRRLLAVTR